MLIWNKALKSLSLLEVDLYGSMGVHISPWPTSKAITQLFLPQNGSTCVPSGRGRGRVVAVCAYPHAGPRHAPQWCPAQGVLLRNRTVGWDSPLLFASKCTYLVGFPQTFTLCMQIFSANQFSKLTKVHLLLNARSVVRYEEPRNKWDSDFCLRGMRPIYR